MPEDKPIEVQATEVTTGKVSFMTKSGFANPPPIMLKRICAALKYFCVSLITAVGATDIFTGGQAKVICFSLGIAILLIGGIEMATGVKPIEEEK